MRRFEGRTALVTGAAHGIGRATATRLAAKGATVAIADIDHTAAAQTAHALTADGTTALPLACDVTDQTDVDNAVAATADRFGRIDVLINNVGIGGSDPPLPDLDDDEWHRQTDPTLHGAVRCVRACLPWLLAAPDGGSVVSVGSVNGMTAVGGIPYSAAKARLTAATRVLAVKYGPKARGTVGAETGWIRFNVVAPGTIRTRVWDREERRDDLARVSRAYPMGRVGKPEDVAAAIAFLASTDASWITGITLPVDGGFLTGPMTLLGMDP